MTALDIARLQIGVTEYPSGSNRVVYNTWYYRQAVSGDAYPWCMAFVQWCCAMAGNPLPCKTASCSTLLNWYRANAPECVTDKPVVGAIVIYKGHCGIVEAVHDGGGFTTIEGNTSVTNIANGGEVQRVRRTMANVVAFIVPKKEEKTVNDVRYQRVEELPEYYRAEAQRLVDRGALRGTGNGLDVTEDMIRTLIICQRMVDGREL